VRLAFMGTPDFAVPTLCALAQKGHEIAVVYSQPPRAGGRRGLGLVASPVHRQAQHLGLLIRTPTLFDKAEQDYFAALKLDAVVVVAYGLLLPAALLDCVRLGFYNGHASLLPRWRGAAPIQRAIMAGDDETGMMVMKMVAGLDKGPVALTHKVPLTEDATAGQIHDILSRIGADLMIEAMEKLEKGTLSLQPQAQEGVVYAHKITKQETKINWERPAIEIERLVRALAPHPAAWCEMEIGGRRERVKILAAKVGTSDNISDLCVACGDGCKLSLTLLQKAGGKPLSATDFLHGHPVHAIA